ncbi:hypothetical protein SPHINGOAX6_70785 [Sphingomonas sp. AX6]|nr:hypothetical protein SPHINGOAX6_70785 [Sphingomonas sp. AX6]
MRSMALPHLRPTTVWMLRRRSARRHEPLPAPTERGAGTYYQLQIWRVSMSVHFLGALSSPRELVERP